MSPPKKTKIMNIKIELNSKVVDQNKTDIYQTCDAHGKREWAIKGAGKLKEIRFMANGPYDRVATIGDTFKSSYKNVNTAVIYFEDGTEQEIRAK